MKLALSIMAVGGTTVFFFGGPIISFFINDPNVISLGAEVMKITCFTSLIFAVIFIYIGVFNGSGYTKATMTINIARLWLFRLPLVLLLSGLIFKFANINIPLINSILHYIAYPMRDRPYFALWYSMLISNAIAAVWSYHLYKKGKWQKTRI
jgi:Na+-driven multidrug efflux pump